MQGGLETPGRRDKFPLNLPAGFPLASAPSGQTLSAMLAEGELDAVISARRPSCFVAGHPMVRRLFPDYRAAERDYYRRSGVFPIMHAVGIRRDMLEQHPWLAASVYKAFVEAKRIADAEFGGDHGAQDRAAMGDGGARRDPRGRWASDFWSYGVRAEPQDAWS